MCITYMYYTCVVWHIEPTPEPTPKKVQNQDSLVPLFRGSWIPASQFKNTDRFDSPWISASLLKSTNLFGCSWIPVSKLKIPANLAVHGSLHSFLKIRTEMAVHGSLFQNSDFSRSWICHWVKIQDLIQDLNSERGLGFLFQAWPKT